MDNKTLLILAFIVGIASSVIAIYAYNTKIKELNI